METITIKRHLDSELLNVPELRAWIGKDVEITFVEEEKQSTPRNGGFADSGGMFPDIDEDAFWKFREASKI